MDRLEKTQILLSRVLVLVDLISKEVYEVDKDTPGYESPYAKYSRREVNRLKKQLEDLSTVLDQELGGLDERGLPIKISNKAKTKPKSIDIDKLPPGIEGDRLLIKMLENDEKKKPKPCLDPDKMHGAADGCGGSDYYGEDI